MTVESDLKLLKKKSKNVVESASKGNQQAAENALGHMMRALAYEGTAFGYAIEHMVNNLGKHLGKIDPNSGEALSEFSHIAFEIADSEAVDLLLEERGIQKTVMPENISIYNQFRSGHYNHREILDWLVGKAE